MLQAHVHERLQAHVRNRRLGAGLWVLLLGGLVACIAGAATLHFACAVRIHPRCMCARASALRVLPPPRHLRTTSAPPPHHLRTAPTVAAAAATAAAPMPQTGGATPLTLTLTLTSDGRRRALSLYIVYDVYDLQAHLARRLHPRGHRAVPRHQTSSSTSFASLQRFRMTARAWRGQAAGTRGFARWGHEAAWRRVDGPFAR